MSEIEMGYMQGAEAQQSPKARFGYRGAKLRAATTIGLIATGGTGLISAIADVITSAQVTPVIDKVASTLQHLQYTVFEPSLPGAVGNSITAAAVSGAVVGAGIVHGLGRWKSSILPTATGLVAGGAALLSFAFGAMTYGGSVGADEAAGVEQSWTQQYFGISRELPDPVSDYNSTSGSYQWYPAVFAISANQSGLTGSDASGSDLKQHYYLVEPVLNAKGDRIGDNVKAVDEATAQKAQTLYTQHSASRSSHR